MSGSFSEGVEDIGRSAYANIGDTYQAVLRGEMAPHATMTGTMEHTVTPAEEPAQSYSAALLEHGAAAGQEAEADHWRDTLAQQTPMPSVDPGMASGPQEPDVG